MEPTNADTPEKVENITLEDGRIAQRRIYPKNEAGEQLIEIYAEQRTPMRLEKRIKEVPANRIVESFSADGETMTTETMPVARQIIDLSPVDPPIEMPVPNYITKDDLSAEVSKAVLEALTAVEEAKAEMHVQSSNAGAVPMRTLSAEEIIASRVPETKSKWAWVLPAIIIFQLVAIVGWKLFH